MKEPKDCAVPTAEIEQDIAETEREIATMEREAAFYESTPSDAADYRWNHMRADARRTGIVERREFIAKLQAVLQYRKANEVQP